MPPGDWCSALDFIFFAVWRSHDKGNEMRDDLCAGLMGKGCDGAHAPHGEARQSSVIAG
jgi:hypothetical protein